MSETMSNPTEWMQFYNQNFSGGSHQGATTTTQPTLFADRASDATVVTPAAAATPLGSGSSSPTAATAGSNRLSPEGGRVSKPIRRRSRASRRTPTTLLNTDTTNFRAMVQQFTGGPSAPFAASGTGPGFSFGLGTRQSFANPSVGMVPALAGYHYQQQQQQQQPHNLYHQQQNQQYGFSLSTGGGGGGVGDSFVQRLSSGRPVMGNLQGVSTDGFLMGVTTGVSDSQVAAAAAVRPSSNPANENRSNNFMF
ncbi:VQ motif containing protein [Parasponia andersonii]|uniref:VQ motif containing protein n=1 Tax=Parasponia andersonii TaxID=3476 RepID=A0A2P5ATI3_PARAD|nr:VQ motif containing protein [Parasponia andersonii]